MFRSFEAHSRVFRGPLLDDYFMISSGTNQFPMPRIWKEAIHLELDSDFLYRWYTSSKGFQCVTSAIKTYEDYVSGPDLASFIRSDRDVSMSFGCCGAVAAVFEFLKSTFRKCRIILVGRSYSLYERLAREFRFPITEMHRADDPDAMPVAEDFRRLGRGSEKEVFIFSIPGNPGGETFTEKEFSKIIDKIKERGGFVILDQTCNLIISRQPLPLYERVITEHNFWDSCAVVNSFSKTDSTAGLRIGYVYGASDLIRSCAALNASTVMNPPTIPVLPIVLCCLFRCLFINERRGQSMLAEQFRRRFKKNFFRTSAVTPSAIRAWAEKSFAQEGYYEDYKRELLENEAIMLHNQAATCAFLEPYIRKISEWRAGFNFCVWFKPQFRTGELELVEQLIDQTGVAILTESCFSMKRAPHRNFFIRFSTACYREPYQGALERLKLFLENEVFAF